MKHLAWLVVVLIGCTELESIDRGVCGNGLLEPGEDCDSSAENCISCGLTCTVDHEQTDCPSSDYHCGADGFCHAPGGALSTPQAVGAFEVNELRIADVDHDSLGDALGVSRSSIVVRYGDAAAPLATVESTVTPPQTGPAALGDLDLDGSDDVSIITLDGIVSYTSRHDRISGLEVVQTIGGFGGQLPNIIGVVGIGPLTIGAFFNLNGNVLFQLVDMVDPDASIGGPPCARTIPASEFSIDNVDVYQLHKPTDFYTNTVVSMISGSGALKQLCVLAIYKSLNGSMLPTLIDVTPTNIGVARKPILADLTIDNDPCPSLVNPTAGFHKWDGAKQIGGHCAFPTAPTDMAQPPNVLPTTPLVGRVPLSPTVLLVAPDLLVFETGVFAYIPGTGPPNDGYVEFYRSARSISGVVIGDFEGDGDADGALIGPGDDIEVLLRSNPALPTFEGFVVDTASQPSLVRIDDFDGNLRSDIAYVEPVGDSVRMMIAYGTADQLLPPIEVARFADVKSMAPIHIPSSSDLLGLTADMVVVFPGSPSKLTLLSGSTQRTMLAFFDPRADSADSNASVKNTTIFRGAVIGRFVTVAGTPDYPDVVGMAALRPGLDTTMLTTVPRVRMRAFSVAGTDLGLDATQSNGVELETAVDCNLPGMMNNVLCVDDAKYVPWPTSETKDVVIAVDNKRFGAVFDPTKIIGGKLTPTPFTLAAPDGSIIRSLRAADLDGDGTGELIASFAPVDSKAPASAILVCSVDATGVPAQCRNVLDAIVAVAPMVTACVDAAPGHVGYRDPNIAPLPGLDLVVLCHDSASTLFRVTLDAASMRVETLVHAPPGLSSIQVGDVTGDQVDDIVAIDGEAGARNLVVLAQCTSRDTVCLEASK